MYLTPRNVHGLMDMLGNKVGLTSKKNLVLFNLSQCTLHPHSAAMALAGRAAMTEAAVPTPSMATCAKAFDDSSGPRERIRRWRRPLRLDSTVVAVLAAGFSGGVGGVTTTATRGDDSAMVAVLLNAGRYAAATTLTGGAVMAVALPAVVPTREGERIAGERGGSSMRENKYDFF